MKVRLGFAVAAHLDPEILIVDEVLAVGDAEFQKRCLGKMRNVAKSGKTVLFVSHNIGVISNLCPKSLLIHNGCLIANGETREVLRQYLADETASSGAAWTASDAPGASNTFAVQRMWLGSELEPRSEFSSGEPVPVSFVVCIPEDSETWNFGVEVRDLQGLILFRSYLNDAGPWEVTCGRHEIQVCIPQNLLNGGNYLISPVVSRRSAVQSIDGIPSLRFRVSLQLPNSELLQHSRYGIIAPVLSWRSRLLPHETN
jgi:lipopolysaccharide transport system ATP-binding protein